MKLSAVLSTVLLSSVTVICGQVPGRPTAPAGLGDLWTGRARWELVHNWKDSTPANDVRWFNYGHSHVEIVDGIWYLFSTKPFFAPSGDPCAAYGKVGVEVRRSIDEGVTWSDPVDAIVPTPGTAWSCLASDGDTFYDPVADKWHFLFQCFSETDEMWNACHLERDGPDPMGEFSASHPNPVVLGGDERTGGDLWNRICDRPEDDCVTLAYVVPTDPPVKVRIFNEGTFEIFRSDDEGYFWVGFHGYDTVQGFRGIAKTRDFIDWIAGDPAHGVPDDAIVDSNDARDWRVNWFVNPVPPSQPLSGNIGAGAGSILYDDGYYYLLTEVYDQNLGGTEGMNATWGLFRSPVLTSTQWEQYPLGNPIFYSAALPSTVPLPPEWEQLAECPGFGGERFSCAHTYGKLFHDPGTDTIYLKISLKSDAANQPEILEGVLVYKLVSSHNILRNGDFWQADEGVAPQEDWKQLGDRTNLAIYRLPGRSSDGNNFMAMNCGTAPGPCSTQSIYQDVDVSGYGGRSFTFGGKLATEGHETGSVYVVVHLLDDGGTPITHVGVRAQAGYRYTAFAGEGTIPVAARTLRYEMYLESPITFLADELYVEILPPVDGQKPGDCNQDGALDISDASCLLSRLFLDASAPLPCGDGSLDDPANRLLLSWNGADTEVDISSAVRLLNFLFLGGPPHVLGNGCEPIAGCPAMCRPGF